MPLRIEIPSDRLQSESVVRAVARLMWALTHDEPLSIKQSNVQVKARELTQSERVNVVYESFLADLPERAQSFLYELEQAGSLNIEDAAKLLECDSVSVNQTISAIQRSADQLKLTLPYEKLQKEGLAEWQWTGLKSIEAGDFTALEKAFNAAEKEAAQQEAAAKAEAKAARKAAKEQPKEQEITSELDESKPEFKYSHRNLDAELSTFTETIPQKSNLSEELLAKVPETSKNFLRELHLRGWMALYQIVAFLELADARLLGGVTEPILRATRELGMEMPYQIVRAESGVKVYLYDGVMMPSYVPPEPEPTLPEPTPANDPTLGDDPQKQKRYMPSAELHLPASSVVTFDRRGGQNNIVPVVRVKRHDD